MSSAQSTASSNGCPPLRTFYPQSDLLQSSVLQHGLGHVSVLDVLEEAVQFGAVDDCRTTQGQSMQRTDRRLCRRSPRWWFLTVRIFGLNVFLNLKNTTANHQPKILFKKMTLFFFFLA